LTPDPSLYLAVAQIAGIFVGFGGIIGSLGDFHARTEAAKLLQSVVTLSLGVMTAALIPATLMQFRLDPLSCCSCGSVEHASLSSTQNIAGGSASISGARRSSRCCSG
jgi:hypothetical protein